MKVRMRVSISGTRNGQDWPTHGSIIDLPDAEAAEYCANGMAEPVATFDKPEKAVVLDAEAEKRGGLTKKSAAAVTKGASAKGDE